VKSFNKNKKTKKPKFASQGIVKQGVISDTPTKKAASDGGLLATAKSFFGRTPISDDKQAELKLGNVSKDLD